MNLDTWSLTGSYFHFGEQGLGQEESRAFWSSDSLFAALVARLALQQGPQAVESWIKDFEEGRPPFLLTSLFPFAGDVLFLPVPLAAQLPDGRPLPKGVRAKDLKKVQFVSEDIYRQLLGGKLLLVDFALSSERIQGGKIWLSPAEHRTLQQKRGQDPLVWKIEKRPRVTLGRFTAASTLFHVGAVHFAPGGGLWFGVQWLDSNEAHKATLRNLLADLGEAGLGAERSVGYGKGTFEPLGSLELLDPQSAWTSLSRYFPREEELDAFEHAQAAWKIQTLAGWLDSPQKRGQRRRAINLVQEGATLGMPNSARLPFGRVEDVRPRYRQGVEYPVEHRVYRCGLTVAVGYGGAT
jgi:CRISPR-associated protein Csm4